MAWPPCGQGPTPVQGGFRPFARAHDRTEEVAGTGHKATWRVSTTATTRVGPFDSRIGRQNPANPQHRPASDPRALSPARAPVITNEPPRRLAAVAGARLISLFAKAVRRQPNRPRLTTKDPHRGEGVFVRASYCSGPPAERKGPFPALSHEPGAAAEPPPRPAAPTPAEKAFRVAALRAALAGTAPLFEARLRRGGEGGR
jgi:hypothetical protein